MIETNAYASVVAAFRAQGTVSWEKMRVLEQLRNLLFINNERHQAEMLRAEADPLLQKLAVNFNESVFEYVFFC